MLMFNVIELFFSLWPGDYINMSLSGSFIVYSVKYNSSVLLMFVLSLGPGDYINKSLSSPLIVYSVVTIIQLHFFLRAWGLH